MLGLENVAVAAFQFIYKRRRPTPLNEKRPWFKWFPKYTSEIELSAEILEAEDPQAELERRVGEMGFRFDSWTKDVIRFTRGKSWGDFSVKWIKLGLSVPYPLEQESSLQLEVAGVCLFDTGDLWKVCRDLVDRIEAGPDETGADAPSASPQNA